MKARFGNQCGYNYNHFDTAFSVVHAGVSYETVNDLVVWAQIGFGMSRNQFDDIPPYFPFVYAEVNGLTNNPQYIFLLDTVVDGSVFDYEMILDINSGTWDFVLNDSSFGKLSLGDWHESGTSAFWVGEILNFEDDMAGTEANRCVLSQCQYKATTWESPDFESLSNPPIVTRSDDDEWWIKIFDNDLLIYDKIPMN